MMLYLVVLFGQIHVGGIRLECLCAVRVAQTLLLDGVHVLRHRRAATRYFVVKRLFHQAQSGTSVRVWDIKRLVVTNSHWSCGHEHGQEQA